MAGDVVVVRTYRDELQAELGRASLESNGVPAIVLRDNAGGMLPVLQVLFEIRLAVRREDADLARRLLDAADEGEDQAPDERVDAGDMEPGPDDWR